MEFEWNPEKAAGNLAKHGVAFAEARPYLAIHLPLRISTQIIRKMKIGS
jgi:uncharacterized DUF497 family protein